MCNSLFIDKKTLPKAKDGEEIEVLVKGIYTTDEEGTRKLDITSVDGNDVVGMDEGESDCGYEKMPDMMDQDSNDAIRIFMIKTKKGK